MSEDQMLNLNTVVNAYRIYLKATPSKRMMALRYYRRLAEWYCKRWGVWPRYTTTRSTKSRHTRATPESLANMVIHRHMESV